MWSGKPFGSHLLPPIESVKWNWGGHELTLATLLHKTLTTFLNNWKVHQKTVYWIFCKLFTHGNSGLLRSDEGCISRMLAAEPFLFHLWSYFQGHFKSAKAPAWSVMAICKLGGYCSALIQIITIYYIKIMWQKYNVDLPRNREIKIYTKWIL